MIRLQDVVQVLDRPVAATAPQDSFLLHSCNPRPVEACLVGVDDAGSGRREGYLSVSNSSSGRRWKLDHAPAVGDPTHMVEFGTGRRAFAREA